jgi:NUMOD3 motif
MRVPITVSATKRGRVPWNKGKRTGQVPWNKGKEHTPETRAKIGDANRGCAPWNKGKELSPEHRANLSAARRGRRWTNPYDERGRGRLTRRRRKLLVDLTGTKHGLLTVVSCAGRRDGSVLWNCRCDCGGARVTSTDKLRTGHVKSCGCLVGRYERTDQARAKRSADARRRRRELEARAERRTRDREARGRDREARDERRRDREARAESRHRDRLEALDARRRRRMAARAKLELRVHRMLATSDRPGSVRIARRLGAPISAVQRALEDIGVPKRPRGRPKREVDTSALLASAGWSNGEHWVTR